VRPATTGLATAFFRFYLLDTLSGAPARPASLLARVAAERVAAAREGGRPFCVVLVAIAIDQPNEATRRAMVHRAIRASLGGATKLFGGDVSAFRYGVDGIALVAPRPDALPLATLACARVDELVRSMTASVRAFHDARWHVHAGGAAWTVEIGTTGALLRAAEDSLRSDGEAQPAA
jgi:GGDEF domain-containing protein